MDRSGEHHLWLGGRNGDGYGIFWLDGRQREAHGVAWERAHGPLPKGQVVRHKCVIRHCVNIDHLESGTKGDNNRDRRRDGTQTRGESHHNSKLTEAIILEAARLHRLGVPWSVIARQFGVNVGTLTQAVKHTHGEWKHVDTGY